MPKRGSKILLVTFFTLYTIIKEKLDFLYPIGREVVSTKFLSDFKHIESIPSFPRSCRGERSFYDVLLFSPRSDLVGESIFALSCSCVCWEESARLPGSVPSLEMGLSV
jgi:hypothetical protein